MNRQSLGALVVLNVVLLAALVVVTLSPTPASAQIGGPRGEYVMIAGQVAGRSNVAVIYILELQSQRMAAVTFDSRSAKMEVLGSREISRDLEAAGPGR